MFSKVSHSLPTINIVSIVHKIQSQQDWENLLSKCWDDSENAAVLIEKLPENKLLEDFTDQKYGNYHRNIHGIY